MAQPWVTEGMMRDRLQMLARRVRAGETELTDLLELTRQVVQAPPPPPAPYVARQRPPVIK